MRQLLRRSVSILGPGAVALASMASGALEAHVAAQWSPATTERGCEPGWVPAFGPAPGVSSHNPQLSSSVSALGVFADAAGPKLFVSGDFSIAGSTFPCWNVATWDGEAWSPVGSGLSAPALAFAVYDDGDGPALYAGGLFQSADGEPADRIAKWNGQAWEALGSGLTGPVYCLQVFDDGSGQKLYVGGDFGGHIARWDGSNWSGVGAGFNNPVHAMAVFDDGRGAGPRLYAAGHFLFSGGTQLRRIAVWNGAAWGAVGAGVAGGEPQTAAVRALVVHSDGNGAPALYAGGDFTAAGSEPASHVARWDGTDWSPLGSGTDGAVTGLLSFDDGSGAGSRLYAIGGFTAAGGAAAAHVATWDGSTWSALGDGTAYGPRALAAFDAGDGRGPQLMVGGTFTTAGSVFVNRIGRWDGSGWSPLGDGPGGAVSALTTHDDGRGPALYVGGELAGVGGVAVNGVARWNGSDWSALGGGMSAPEFSGFFPFVLALATFDDGGGPALYAGGEFEEAGGVLVNRIAKWDGTSWSALGTGMDDRVTALIGADEHVQGGAALYAVGEFITAGGVSAYSLARWDGRAWSSMGDVNDPVRALALHDDGSGGGPALYAAGRFTYLGTPANGIARWNGTSWSAVGGGLIAAAGPADVSALVSFDDGLGDGPVLFAGGDFTSAGGVPANRVARWDGSTWSALGSGMDAKVVALAGFDDGTGPALYACGEFLTAGGTPAKKVAKWTGSEWLALEGGFEGWPAAMHVFDDGTAAGPRLFIGGEYLLQPDAGDGYLATWGGCAPPASPWTHLGFALPGIDGAPLLAGSGALVPASAGALSLTDAAPLALAPLFVALTSNPTPFKGGFLLPVPVAVSMPLVTSPAGALTLAWTSWPAGLSGLSFVLQHAIADAAAPHGVALSNALRADVP